MVMVGSKFFKVLFMLEYLLGLVQNLDLGLFLIDGEVVEIEFMDVLYRVVV